MTYSCDVETPSRLDPVAACVRREWESATLTVSGDDREDEMRDRFARHVPAVLEAAELPGDVPVVPCSSPVGIARRLQSPPTGRGVAALFAAEAVQRITTQAHAQTTPGPVHRNTRIDRMCEAIYASPGRWAALAAESALRSVSPTALGIDDGFGFLWRARTRWSHAACVEAATRLGLVERNTLWTALYVCSLTSGWWAVTPQAVLYASAPEVIEMSRRPTGCGTRWVPAGDGVRWSDGFAARAPSHNPETAAPIS